jgi:hypothetical protein
MQLRICSGCDQKSEVKDGVMACVCVRVCVCGGVCEQNEVCVLLVDFFAPSSEKKKWGNRQNHAFQPFHREAEGRVFIRKSCVRQPAKL